MRSILGPALLLVGLLPFLVRPTALRGQRGGPGADARFPASAAVASWTAVDVATGYETRMSPRVADALPGWTTDRWGNVVRTVGSGSPHRVLACRLDAPAYAVSQIREDGYLRVHRIGRGSRHPLWDQQHQAKPVRILAPGGPVIGVVARTNGHFAAQHRDDERVVTADELWVDVGGGTREEVEAMGIGLLDPVLRQLPPWVLEGGQVAGPVVGQRAGCAIVAALGSASESGPGRTTFLLAASSGFGDVGLAAAVRRGPPVDEVVLLAGGSIEPVDQRRAVGDLGRLGVALAEASLQEVRWIEARVARPGAHLEWITAQEIERYAALAAEAIGRSGGSMEWVSAPAPADPVEPRIDPELREMTERLDALVEIHGVSAHEWAVRRALLEALPAWARERAVVDGIGNVVVEMGPERDTTVFMAHLDEVGYHVTRIEDDGHVALRAAGGALDDAWEGETALLHFDPPGAPSTADGDPRDLDPRFKRQSLEAEARAPLRGVFSQRSPAEGRWPDTLTAWFGVDGPRLRELGVREGMQVTMYKEGLRLGPDRFVARGLDDRAGTTALLLALARIDPESLDHKLIFAWSVHEAGGLIGAEAMAARYAHSTRRIYSVDTFVSSDTPLESPHFAFTPLGDGPVLRAIENSGVSPDRERARVLRIAREAGIPLQMGLTQGGTDGTTFTYRGAPNQGLSWPGRYSHSPGEVLDLRDLARLVDLVEAVAKTGG
ncbi:MAG: M28 family peptidase [Gemmatimonadota bacterium]